MIDSECSLNKMTCNCFSFYYQLLIDKVKDQEVILKVIE